jgi:hypothetical protein
MRTAGFVGDSLTVQYATNCSFRIQDDVPGALLHEAWPMIAGAMGGFAPINLRVGSALPTDFATTYP